MSRGSVIMSSQGKSASIDFNEYNIIDSHDNNYRTGENEEDEEEDDGVTCTIDVPDIDYDLNDDPGSSYVNRTPTLSSSGDLFESTSSNASTNSSLNHHHHVVNHGKSCSPVSPPNQTTVHVSPGSSSPPVPSDGSAPVRILLYHWAEYVDPSSKRKFYYNFVSRESSWKPPRRGRPACFIQGVCINPCIKSSEHSWHSAMVTIHWKPPDYR